MKTKFTLFLAFTLLALGVQVFRAEDDGTVRGEDPTVDPSGDLGALKMRIETGCGYDVRSGNGSRSITDLNVPGAAGGSLNFTRHWNSLFRDDAHYSFGSGGWSHSWEWTASYETNMAEEERGSVAKSIITVYYPDGQTKRFQIQRDASMTDRPTWGPPYAQSGDRPEVDWQDLGLNYTDHLRGMQENGEQFWLVLGSGGAIRFTGGPDAYVATEVIDPHGLITRLHYYADRRLRQVEGPDGRTLNITWGEAQLPSGYGTTVLWSVESAGQVVQYHYSGFAGATEYNSRNINWVALTSVVYVGDVDELGQPVRATYAYKTFAGEPAYRPRASWAGPRLIDANDPRFAGAMRHIHYVLTETSCERKNQPKPGFEPYQNAKADYYYAAPFAISEEQSGDDARHVNVSGFFIGCFNGTRREYKGSGGFREFYYGGAAGKEPGAVYVGDSQTGHWEPPEAGQGGYGGFLPAKVTEYTNTYPFPADLPFDFQHSFLGHPWRVFDGRRTLTQITTERATGRMSAVWHRGSDNSQRTYNWNDSGNSAPQDFSRLPNKDKNWLFSETDERGLTTIYRRDSLRRVTDVTYPGGSTEHFDYNTLNQVTNHVLPSGAVKSYQYDDRWLLRAEWNSVDGYDARKEYLYDHLDRVQFVSDGRSRTAGAPYSTFLEYNNRHQIIKVHYPATGLNPDPTVVYEYDGYGNCIAITNELGQRSTYKYDEYRRCIEYTEPLDAPNWDGTSTVASRTWNWYYDRVDTVHPFTQHDALSHTSKDWRIQQEPAFNPQGDRRMTVRGYDFNERMVFEMKGLTMTGPSTWIYTASSETHRFEYDKNGNKRTYIDPRNRATTYLYDKRDRLEKTTEPLDRITETGYDATGNKLWMRFPDQQLQRWEQYDAFGQARRFIDERNNPTDLTFQWGPMKKLRSVTTHRRRDDGVMEDQLTTFTPDDLGRPWHTLFPDQSSEQTTYRFGQIETFRTRKGATKVIEYDARGREEHHYWTDATPEVFRKWDDASRLLRLENRFSLIEYEYDSAGQAKFERNTIAGATSPGQINYLRYPSGQVSFFNFPYGFKLRKEYNARGLLSTMGWNSDNATGEWGYRVIQYDYLPDGKVNYQDYGNGMRTAFDYNERGMARVVHTYHVPSNGNYSHRTYGRDERDRITSWQKAEDGRGDRYGYDAEGQLTSAFYQAQNPGGTPTDARRSDSFAYDALGNRYGTNTVASRGAVNFSRRDNGLNQYLSWSPSVINYEGNGVLIQEGMISSDFNALNQPNWMWANRMSAVMRFGYDPLGRCVKRWFGPDDPAVNPATYFYYDGWNLIQEGPAEWPSRLYAHGNRVDEVVVSFQNSTAEHGFHHYDARGHTILLTNGEGYLMEQYDYDAFGKPYFYSAGGTQLPDSPFGNRILFTGREWLKELGVYDFRHRHYQPELGRFLQPDPKQFDAGDYNLYRYCHNDPINCTDPTGTDAVPNGDGTYHFVIRPDLNLGNLTGTHITHPNPRYTEQCAQGAQFLTGTHADGRTYDAPRTRTWTQGDAVGANTKPGTMIATGFDDGKYPSKHPSEYKKGETINHTGIYVGPGKEPGTIKVFDQMAGKNGTLNTRTYKASGWSIVISGKKHSAGESLSAPRAIKRDRERR